MIVNANIKFLLSSESVNATYTFFNKTLFFLIFAPNLVFFHYSKVDTKMWARFFPPHKSFVIKRL
uniref:Uncharacterized protein n=1 Tax=Anguilla anguilla TaxID=7936 RepID=A0A0E9Q889_ANGAN